MTRFSRRKGEQARTSRGGFTLGEVLVSMAILAMLVVFFAQALGSIGGAWSRAQAKMDNFGKARALLGRMQIDLQNIVLRNDLPRFPGGELAFYTLQPGLSAAANRSLSYVRYSIGPKRDQLIRTDFAYAYGTPLEFEAAPTPTYAAMPSPTPPELSGPSAVNHSTVPLSVGQLSFAYGFLHSSDGKYSASYDADSSGAPDPAIAVTIGLVAMDNKNAVLLEKRGVLKGLIDDLKVSPPNGVQNWSPKAIWDYRLGASSEVPASESGPRIVLENYGASFLAGVRAFERTFPLSSPKSY